MTRDDAKIANALWDRHKDTLNTIARHGFGASDFVIARIWQRVGDIEPQTTMDQVRLRFLDRDTFEFPDQSYIGLEIGVEVLNGERFEMCALPIKLDLEIGTYSGLSISISLALPKKDSEYRPRFEQALLNCKPPIRPEPEEWCTSVELGKVEIGTDCAAFDIDALVDQLTATLRDITERVLEPLALALTANTTPN